MDPRPLAAWLSRRNLKYLTAPLAGLVYALCFAPGPLPSWALPFVQIGALAVLAAITLRAPKARSAALYGWLFAWAQFALGLYWLVISMHRYGGLALPLAIGALLLFAGAMALYAACACALAQRLLGRGTQPPQALDFLLQAAVWASCWVAFEWLRAWLFTGFPWLSTGYAHAEGMFAAWAAIGGVHTISWIAAFSACAIALFARVRNTEQDRLAAAGIGASIALGLLGIVLGHVQWSKPSGAAFMVRLVQPATDQALKFDPASFAPQQQRLMRLASYPLQDGQAAPQLIILPETALPILQDMVPEDIWRGWQEIADQTQASIILGAPLRLRADATARYANGALLIRPGARAPEAGWHYEKHHLVPFGEFIPPGFRWFVEALQIPLGDFDRGDLLQDNLRINGQDLAINICYEDIFGAEIAQRVAGGPGTDSPGLLVNLSNLAWFGDSWAQRQHLWMARMRSLESARPSVRATNTGATAAISAMGTVGGVLKAGVPGVLDAEVQAMSGATPYVRWGNAPILFWMALVVAAARLRWRKK